MSSYHRRDVDRVRTKVLQLYMQTTAWFESLPLEQQNQTRDDVRRYDRWARAYLEWADRVGYEIDVLYPEPANHRLKTQHRALFRKYVQELNEWIEFWEAYFWVPQPETVPAKQEDVDPWTERAEAVGTIFKWGAIGTLAFLGLSLVK